MIIERLTGRQLSFEIHPVESDELDSFDSDWAFDWELQCASFETFKLIVAEFPDEIQGLVSIKRSDGFIEILLLENSPRNVGQEKWLVGVCGNLLASAIRLSFQLGHDGVLLLQSKTQLIDHYKRVYGFTRMGRSHKLKLETVAAIRLISTYQGRIFDGTST